MPDTSAAEQMHAYWAEQIQSYEKQYEAWEKGVDDIVKRYRDEENIKLRGGKYNIFYSNVQTIAPAIYNNPPTPVVERRNKNKDAVGRIASLLLENRVDTELETYDFSYAMRGAVLDYILSGRGTAWVRYEAEFTAEPTGEVDPVTLEPVIAEVKAYERTWCDFVPYSNFGHTPARNWSEVRAVWKSTLMSKRDLERKFPDLADQIPLSYADDGKKADSKKSDGRAGTRALIYEIWDKDDRKVFFFCKDYTAGMLMELEDPLALEDFFPCPRPMYGMLPADSLRPLPDYQMVRHQLEEIDKLTKQINTLINHLKLKGAYDGSVPDLKKLLDVNADVVVSVNNWANLSEKGGLQKALEFLPLGELVGALKAAVEMREQLKRDVDEITGISDIIRGQGVASETATAQRIKGNFATMRLDDRKAEVARFARDIVRITAEIIAELYDESALMASTDLAMFTEEEKALIPQAVALLRDQKQRGFRIEIETDSTIAADEERERSGRMEFLTAVGGFMQQSLPVVQAAPQTAPLVSEMLLFAVRTFSKGRTMESAFEEFARKAQEAAKMAEQAPPQPNPAEELKKQELGIKQFDAETKRIAVEQRAPIPELPILQ